jgi:protein-S-isoprenylcysteine O-methyltransferase Ste14
MTAGLYAVLGVGWLVWLAPFFLRRPQDSVSAQTIDRRARWGMALQGASYALAWQGQFWTRALASWQIALGVLLLAAAAGLSWTGVRALGRQWRVDAGLNPDHALVRSGPYRLVRHPIYSSMFCLLLGTGTLVSPLSWLLASVAVFVVGTEIRVRVEDALLASRFGPAFSAFQRAVPAYVPFIR